MSAASDRSCPVQPGAQADEAADEGSQNDNLAAVMESMGIYDTDLRARSSNSNSLNETQRLLKMLLATLNRAVVMPPAPANHAEPPTGAGRVEPAVPDPDLRPRAEPASQTNYTEVSGSQLHTRDQ